MSRRGGTGKNFHYWRNFTYFAPQIREILIQNITPMSEIAERVKTIVVDKLGADPAKVTEEAVFTTDLNADSLDTVELIMDFEKEFGITIPEPEAEKIKTVGDAIAFVEANV